MGFIKNALIGIALYEAAKYLLRKEDYTFDSGTESFRGGFHRARQLRDEDFDVIAGARQPDHLQQTKTRSSSQGISSNAGPVSGLESDKDLLAGSDPEIPLAGQTGQKDSQSPWKNSLANDELRAPDS